MKPLLEAAHARVDVDAVPQLDDLSLETSGERVLILAGPTALFAACAGMLKPRHGQIRTSGVSPLDALRQRLLATVPLDPPVPPSWKVREYAEWSARLAGNAEVDARALTREALDRLKLGSVADVRLRYLPLPARRALGVAAALATGAGTLFLEDPLRGLPDDAARDLARLLVRATASLRTVVFAARASLSSPLAIDADEALVIHGSRVDAQGAPAEVAAAERSYLLRVHGPAADFARQAERRGARVSGQGGRLRVDLGTSLEVSDLLDVAAASGSIVLELRPLTHAFA